MIVQWFLSRTVRQATDLRKHVRKLLNAQRDILSAPAIEGLQTAVEETRTAVAAGANKAALLERMTQLEKTANKWLKPYPKAGLRENVEVLLVAIAVAMGIRTFFLQPFKIPTGSMQPTLFGVTSANLRNRPDFQFPTGWARVREWFEGVSYVHEIAPSDGTLELIEPPRRLLIFNLYQRYFFNGRAHIIWFPPDCGTQTLEGRAGLSLPQTYRQGEDIIKLAVQSGDHLFVDRFTYNFRRPRRGEIIVFETRGIMNPRSDPPEPAMPQDQFYIKRMVAMSGERVQIGPDRHLTIHGRRLDASTPHFENVYSFDPNEPPSENHYSGHVNDPRLAPLFDKPEGVLVRTNHYMVMGDNTLNSYDSRAWGDFPRENVMGKSCFVYWPITSRFGWGHR